MVNWEDKVSNTKEIARKLNISLDSLVFFDDSISEREIVKQFLPEVQVIEVDQDALIGGEMFVGQKTKDEMIEYIKSSKEVSVFSEKEDAVIEKAKDLAELISLSDHILHIVPKDLFMKICM